MIREGIYNEKYEKAWVFLAMLFVVGVLGLFIPIRVFAATDGVEINETNFPDSIFRRYLKDIVDRDHNNILSEEEIEQTEVILLRTEYLEENPILSLKGIEYFTALKFLYCEDNELTCLDVSRNTALECLICNDNDLSSLDLSCNTVLQRLECGNNKLMSLNLSQNTALESLRCGGNELTSLDVSQNAALIELECGNNELISLDVSQNTALKSLLCDDNKLTSLDISRNAALETLQCANNKLASLNVKQNAVLDALVCGGNELTDLDVSQNIVLMHLRCERNGLTNLDVSQNTALRYLWCEDNELESLDVSQNTALWVLSCQGNRLKSLDVSQNTDLDTLDCRGNELTSLDISQITGLGQQWWQLECTGNKCFINVNSDGTFDLRNLPGGFDVARAYGWQGGTVNGTMLTIDSGATEVSYDYNIGNGKSVAFTLAVSRVIEYEISVADSINGIVTVSADKAAAGTQVTLSASPDRGFCFKEWQVISGSAVITVNDNTFEMPAGNVIVKAFFERNAVHSHKGEAVAGYEGSCRDDGWKDYYFCADCEKYFTDSTCMIEIIDLEEWKSGDGKIPAADHDFSEWTITKKATEDAVGERARVCSVCGYRETEEIHFSGVVQSLKSGKENVNTGITSNPQTNDDSNIFFWIAMLFVSLGGTVEAIIYRRKEKCGK